MLRAPNQERAICDPQIKGAEIHARHAREADRAEAHSWSLRDGGVYSDWTCRPGACLSATSCARRPAGTGVFG